MRGFRNLLAAALLGALAALLLIGLGLALTLTLARERPPKVAADSVLVLDLSRPIGDRAPEEDLLGMALERATGAGPHPLRLDQVVRALDHAAQDGRVRAVLLTGKVAQSGLRSGWPALGELRAALERVRAAGKPVAARQLFYGEPELYLASAAGELWIDPLGALRIDGFAYEVLFFARALEDLGVEVQVGRVGRYKSAVEPFVRTGLSEEARAQLEDLLETQERAFRDALVGSRPIEREELARLEREAPILDAKAAIASGLVDRAVASDEEDRELARLCGEDPDWSPPRIDVAEYAAAVLPAPSPTGARVAVLVAEGTILDGAGAGNVQSEELEELIEEALRDDDVRALVLRVNSPGGSIDASERIRRALERLAESKPLVVSMGSVAASGGYWIACPAHEILAHPNTITGSIGVFYLAPNVGGLARRLGVDVEWVQTAEHATAESLFQSRSPEQLATLQAHVETMYEAFLERVSNARGLSREEAHAAGEGRVWSGERALELGLVDQLGGLDQAIAAAASRAGLEAPVRLSFPQARERRVLLRLLLEDLVAPAAGAGRAGPPPAGAAPLTELDLLRRTAHAILGSADGLGATLRPPYELRIR